MPAGDGSDAEGASRRPRTGPEGVGSRRRRGPGAEPCPGEIDSAPKEPDGPEAAPNGADWAPKEPDGSRSGPTGPRRSRQRPGGGPPLHRDHRHGWTAARTSSRLREPPNREKKRGPVEREPRARRRRRHDGRSACARALPRHDPPRPPPPPLPPRSPRPPPARRPWPSRPCRPHYRLPVGARWETRGTPLATAPRQDPTGPSPGGGGLFVDTRREGRAANRRPRTER